MNFSDFKKSENLLTKEQMKNVKGGSGTCGYMVTIPASYDDPTMGYVTLIDCNVSKRDALSMVSLGSGWWCCDSCSTTSYCGGASSELG